MIGKANSSSITPKLKKALRKEVALRVSALSYTQRQHQIQKVTERLLTSQAYKQARSVCVFLSMPSEFDTGLIVKDIFQTQRKCYVPKVESAEDMSMLQAFSLADIAAFPLSKYSIPEPGPNCVENDDSERDNAMLALDVDLFLVPGVAFDTQWRRLGHGRGYYDRYLNEMENRLKAKSRKLPFLIGLAFTEQMVTTVPVESHDRLLDEVLFVPVETENEGSSPKRKKQEV